MATVGPHVLDQWLLDDYWRAIEALTPKFYFIRYNRMYIPMTGIKDAKR